ncbi:MAG: glycoside hydrolase family 20 zincin-like fold domain-containing protein [Armatimonadota bacterium]
MSIFHRAFRAAISLRAFACVLLTTSVIFNAERTANAAVDSLTPVTSDRLTVGWAADKGLTVSIDGVPFILRSTLAIVKPGWSGVILNQPSVKRDIVDWRTAPDGSQTAAVTLENNDAVCRYAFSVSPKNSFTVDLAYQLKRDIPAEFEYAAGFLSGPLLQGADVKSYSAQAKDASIASVPPRISFAPPAAGTTQEQNRIGPPLKTVTFGTRLGDISVNYSGSAPAPVLFDGRSDSGVWATDFPLFWLGVGSPAPAIKLKDGERHAVFTFSVAPPTSAAVTTAAPSNGASAEPVASAFVPTLSPTPLVLPRPKAMTFRSGAMGLRLGKTTRIVLADKSPNARKAAHLLLTEISQRFGFLPKVLDITGRETLFDSLLIKDAIVLGVGGKSDQLSRTRLPVPAKPEGYAVAVGPNQALVAGTDEAGVLWGAQTLIQLFAADAAGPLIRPVVIQDWPTLSVRSAHLFYGREALPFHKKLIDRVLARFKMNALFIQAEQVRWDADPAVAPDWAGTKADLAKEIAFASDRGVTVYPLLESYGHMEWLFKKSGNIEFAEDPETPYAVNTSNPKAMSYLETFNAEADSLFGAPGFHAGLDEVTMRGRFPYRSLPRTFPDLFVSNATYWYNFAAKRGKPLWMWADMALHPSEVSPCFGTAPTAKDAAAVRAGLPKDIVMVDWQYSPHPTYPSLKVLKDAGFQKLVAAVWYYPEGIQNFSKAAAQIGALGGMITTWAGYESKEAVLDTVERRQFTAMVLAADYFWNGGEGPAPQKLPYDFAQVFAQQWAGVSASDYLTRSGSGVRFSPNTIAADWAGYGTKTVFSAIPTAQTRLADGVRYRFPDKAGEAVVLSGKLNPPGSAAPESVTVPLVVEGKPNKIREVRLVLAASHQAIQGTKLGTISFTSADGTVTNVDLIYGKNIAAWNDPRSVSEAPVIVRGKTSAGGEAVLRSLNWRRGAGAFAPTSLTITSANTEAAPVLFAVTALE